MERSASTARIRARLSPALAALALLAAGAAGTAFAQGRPAPGSAPPVTAVVQTEHVRAELVAHAPDGVVAGRTVRVGLKLAHAPQWHTYWKNAGDSGLPTQLAWTLPSGFAASEIRWPVPEAIAVGPLVNYGYEGDILLAADVSVPAGFTGPTLDVRLKADWLVCREVCIPEDGTFAIAVPARGASSGAADAFAAADARLPKPAPGAKASATVEGDGSALVVVAEGLPAAAQGRTLAFFAETPNTIEHAARVTQSWNGDRWTVRVPLSPQRSESPTTMPALVVDAATGTGWPVAVDVRGWPAGAVGASPGVAAQAAVEPSRSAASEAPVAASPALIATLGVALLGGLLLNLMPCVFPVLSIKLLSYAGMPQSRRLRVGGGVAYAAGVVLSFLALGGALLVLRAGGEQLGWGFQLQSPLVVAGLAVLFTLLGLNLVGVFEFGNVLPSRVACSQLRHPLADDLFTGVLAVAVASPCTAPFMGAATGATLALPPAQAMAVFGAVGLGMALPFLVASVVPQFARLLPKPGPWLGRFRALMAFPMFATVVWLVWVLGRQAGVDGVAVVLALLVAVAFAAWALGGRGFGRRSRLGFGAVGAALVAGVVSMGWPMLVYPDPGSTSAAGSPQAATTTARWRVWSPELLQAARGEGRTVFVDFTAAWCITCQVNKRTTLADDAVLDAFRDRGVALLRADWTLRDGRITAELAKLGRSGVPVYALYPADGGAPRILPELLSAGAVLDALSELGPPAPRAAPVEPIAPAARPSALPTSLQTSLPTSVPGSPATSILSRITP